MTGLYSERFLTVAAAGVDVTYTVPAGKRAVVRCIVLANNTAAGVLAIVGIGAAYLYYGLIPVQNTVLLGELRVPVYAGEVIGGYVGAGGATVAVAGYLFSDPSGARAPEEEYSVHGSGPSVLPHPAAGGR